MHIPDGFLNNNVAGPLVGAAGAFAGVAVHKVRQAVMEKVAVAKQKLATFPQSDGATTTTQSRISSTGKQYIMRMATVGAFIFAAQMVNFPITNGTSGHLLGGAIAALVLGPWAGFLVIAVVLVIQAFMFGDGGMIALGANIINMGVIGAIGSWYLFRWLYRWYQRRERYFLLAAGIVAWFSVVLAATAASVELAITGAIPLGTVLPAMLGVHILIGVGEALITIAVIGYLRKRGEPLAAVTENKKHAT